METSFVGLLEQVVARDDFLNLTMGISTLLFFGFVTLCVTIVKLRK